MGEEGHDLGSQLKQARQRLAILDTERSSLLQFIATLERQSSPECGSARPLASSKPAPTIVRNHMPDRDKIKLFRSIFRGREDVYALRFESKRTGRNGYRHPFFTRGRSNHQWRQAKQIPWLLYIS